MTQFDYIILIIVFLSVLLGWWRGLVYEILSLISWVTAYVVAKYWAAELTAYMPDVLESEALKSAAAFTAVFVATLMVCAMAAWLLSKLIKSFGLDWRTDGVMGGLFGLVRGLLLVLVFVLLAGLTKLPQTAFWRDALLSKPLQNLALQARDMLPDDMAKRVSF